MQQTFNGYIDNPMGKGSTLPMKASIQQQYNDKYGKVMLKEAGKIKTFIFRPTKDDKYYIHLKIPSESTEKFYYDVVIQFYPGNNDCKAESHLNNYFCRFFSNDPAFVYTHANAFKKQDLFIRELSTKMPILSMKQSAVVRNPSESIMYVKSIYFAYLYMKANSLFNKAIYSTNGIPFDIGTLKANVTHASDKIKEAEEHAKQARLKKKKEREQQLARSKNVNKDAETPKSKVSIKSKLSKTAKKISTIKKASKVHKTTGK